MKKTILKVFCFVVLTVLAMCINTKNVKAVEYITSRNAEMDTYATDTNYFTHNFNGGKAHTRWKYGLKLNGGSPMQVWCIQVDKLTRVVPTLY